MSRGLLPIFRAAVAHAVRSARWDDAVRLLLRFATFCDVLQARNSQSKAYLSAIVVRLHTGQAPEAWTVYQEAQTASAFSASDEAVAADALFAAYRARSAEAVAAVVQDHATFLHLDNQVGGFNLRDDGCESVGHRFLCIVWRMLGSIDWHYRRSHRADSAPCQGTC